MYDLCWVKYGIFTEGPEENKERVGNSIKSSGWDVIR